MSANITLKNIIERKIKYAKTQKENAAPIDFSVTDPYEITYEEFVSRFNGEIKALDDMLADVEHMEEKDFAEKYLGIVKTLQKEFDEQLEEKYNKIVEAKEKGSDVYEVVGSLPRITDKEGYNNAIAEIMVLLDPESMLK